MMVLGLQRHATAVFKGEARYIHSNGEFVVNLCDESLAEAMNDTAIDSPPDVDEAQSLSLAPSTNIADPRIAQAPFASECRRHSGPVENCWSARRCESTPERVCWTRRTGTSNSLHVNRGPDCSPTCTDASVTGFQMPRTTY